MYLSKIIYTMKNISSLIPYKTQSYSLIPYKTVSLLIDFDKSRIISVHAIHRDYDWFSIVYDEIKNRK